MKPETKQTGIWDERSKTFIEPSGTVKQGRRPMFQPHAATELPKSLGRNGYIKTTGLVVELTHGGSEVLIAPLTSRKTEARCYVSMPAAAVASLVRALTQIGGNGYSIVNWPKAEGSAQ